MIGGPKYFRDIFGGGPPGNGGGPSSGPESRPGMNGGNNRATGRRSGCAGMTVLVIAFLVCGRAWSGPQNAPRPSGPGLSPNIGARLSSDIVLRDEAGREFRLMSLLDRPAILSLVYYDCMHICPQVLVGLGVLIQEMDLSPGRDYRIITVSFDENDGPAQAARIRHDYLKPLGGGFPPEAWTFATASPESIAGLVEAVGFRFLRVEHGFIHPVILVFLAPGGVVSGYAYPARYKYGMAVPLAFSAPEMRRSLLAAGRGDTDTGPPHPLLFCFPMEPAGQVLFEKMTGTAGLVTLAAMAGLFAFLATARRRRNKENP